MKIFHMLKARDGFIAIQYFPQRKFHATREVLSPFGIPAGHDNWEITHEF